MRTPSGDSLKAGRESERNRCSGDGLKADRESDGEGE